MAKSTSTTKPARTDMAGKGFEPVGSGPMNLVTGWREARGDCIDDELLQNMQQLIPAACASRGRWGGWNRRGSN